MAHHTDHPGTLMAQEIDFDNADQPGIAQPYSQSEIEDLLYGTDRPASARLARLQELRQETAVRESGDWGGEDPAAMLGEIDRAIEELGGSMDNLDDTADYAGLAVTSAAQDERLDTLAPDDFEARRAIEQGSEVDDSVPEDVEETEEAAGDLDAKDSAD